MTNKPMTKDDAVDIAHTARLQTLEELLANYSRFHKMVEVTPITHHIQHTSGTMQSGVEEFNEIRGLHAAIGMSTEAAEMLDAYKKYMFGKRRPIRIDNMREELGDMFFYFFLMMDAYGFNLKEIIADNVVKLANRYIERFEV